MAAIGSWLARTPGLRLDGRHPTGKELAARLASFWLPGEPLVFAAATDRSIGGRVAALVRHVPGDRQPHPDGQWLHVLVGLRAARIWWAATDAPDESLDALLSAFESGLDPDARAGLPDRDVVLPFATTRRPTGERKASGISGAVAPADRAAGPTASRVTDLPPAAADGTAEVASRAPMQPRSVPPPPGHAPRRRADDGAAPPRRTSPTAPTPRRAGPTRRTARQPGPPAVAPTAITPDGLARLQAEHDELTRVRRPAVVARIRAAKELGDLKENAEYHAAREEQSFLEGRVQAVEAILRSHEVVESPGSGAATVHIGSTVTVADTWGEATWTIVGPTEANPNEGRISVASPVGAALLGHAAGEDVTVRTPRGDTVYRIVTIN
jgi:transcription elongation factor GreA